MRWCLFFAVALDHKARLRDEIQLLITAHLRKRRHELTNQHLIPPILLHPTSIGRTCTPRNHPRIGDKHKLTGRFLDAVGEPEMTDKEALAEYLVDLLTAAGAAMIASQAAREDIARNYEAEATVAHPAVAVVLRRAAARVRGGGTA